jgi:hypothetical protein
MWLSQVERICGSDRAAASSELPKRALNTGLLHPNKHGCIVACLIPVLQSCKG